MSDNLRTAAIGAFGGTLVMAIMAQAPMAIRSDGIQFTDGTVQTTAASNAEAWPYVCTQLSGSPLVPGDAEDLLCYSHIVGTPPPWDRISGGVPEGFYFLVMDMLLTTSGGSSLTGNGVLFQRDSVSPADRLDFTFSGGQQTEPINSSAPMMILAPGHSLDVTNSGGSTGNFDVRVLGYLTTDPASVY